MLVKVNPDTSADRPVTDSSDFKTYGHSCILEVYSHTEDTLNCTCEYL